MATPKPEDLFRDALLRDAPVVEGYKVLPPCALYAKIGAGGMGAVYRGRHVKLDIDVAVKCLKGGLSDDVEYVQRFRREARIASTLHHQNLVHTMDVESRYGLHYMVMEFVKGETARQRLRRKGQLTEKEARAILLGAAEGMAAAHAEGIVHRDLKPDNVLISVTGRVKVADLGLAKAAGGIEESFTLTHGIMGTPQYMPPEQWHDSRSVGPAGDVWALGATLYFLLCGDDAFSSKQSMTQIADRIRFQPFPDAALLRPDALPELLEVLRCCTDRDPARRYPDAAALARTLRDLCLEDDGAGLVDPSGVDATRLSLVSPPPKESLARIRSAIQSDPLFRADLSTLPAASPDTPTAPPAASGVPTLPTPAQPSPRSWAWRVAALVVLALAGFGAWWFLLRPGTERPGTGVPTSPEPSVASKASPPESQPAPVDAVAGLLSQARADLLGDRWQNAIEPLRSVLGRDREHREARELLARARTAEAQALQASGDLELALEAASDAVALDAGNDGARQCRTGVEDRIRSRLRDGVSITAPLAKALVPSRTVVVRGRVTEPLVKVLRIGGDAVVVRDGAFESTVTAPADREFAIPLDLEAVRGIRASLTHPIRVDTAAPQVSIEEPSADQAVARQVEVKGRVLDDSPVSLTVNALPARVEGERWSALVQLEAGRSTLRILAVDAAGNASPEVTRTVRVVVTGPDGAAPRVAVAMMPKNKSDPYFASCREGAQAAAAELGVELLWEGPDDTDAARQNELVEAWIQKRVDVIAVSVENQAAISTILRKARAAGIKVLTWDADAETDARDAFINHGTEEAIGFALIDEAGRILGGKGSFAIVSATVTAADQNAWLRHIQARLKDKWPDLQLVTTRYSDGLRYKAFTETKNLLRAFPQVQLVMAIAAAAVPGAAEAVKEEGSKVKVIGLSVPCLCRDYVHQGVIESIMLWNTVDLGYLTVHAARALREGSLTPGSSTTLRAGRLGSMEVRGDQVLLGAPFRFTRENIDQFKF